MRTGKWPGTNRTGDDMETATPHEFVEPGEHSSVKGLCMVKGCRQPRDSEVHASLPPPEATARPWEGRNDGLIASRVGNVRFVLRIERHGPAATLDDEDRACMDLVLCAVNSFDTQATRLAELEAENGRVSAENRHNRSVAERLDELLTKSSKEVEAFQKANEALKVSVREAIELLDEDVDNALDATITLRAALAQKGE